MGIEVQLRRETGEIIGEVSDVGMVLSRASHNAFSGTRLLKYVVPWGDTIFNHAQAADLAADIRQVVGQQAGTPLADSLHEVQLLADRLSAETHAYLWFIGD